MPRKTALYDRHVALGGRMIEFAGWLLPVQYTGGPLAEHQHVRQSVGLFDIDHMGQVVVRGPDALSFLNRVMTADVARFDIATAHYSLMCYADGGVVDDTFTYRLDANRYFVAVNASNDAKDTRWLQYQRAGEQVVVENVSEATYMLALQGPRAADVLAPLAEAPVGTLRFHHAVETQLLTTPRVQALVGRTGYTGEDGFELFFTSEHAAVVWDVLMEAGRPFDLSPIGLAARDSLRFEPCLPLYGQEISAHTDPLEAGLGWAVALDKGPFVGRDALLKHHLEGTPRRLVGFEMTQGGVPRHGYSVVIDGAACGTVTTGMYAPTLDKMLGLAYIPSEHAAPGTAIGIEIRDKVKPAVVVPKPFYQPGYRKPSASRS